MPKKEKREAEAEAKPYYGYGYGVPLVAVETVELEPCKVCILNAQHVFMTKNELLEFVLQR